MFKKREIVEKEKEELNNKLLGETEECMFFVIFIAIFYDSGINDELNIEKEAIVVSSLVEDNFLNSQNYFSRGSPEGILKICQDYWNGKTVEPITEDLIQKLYSILQQWNSSNIQAIAFSYRPQKKNFSEILSHFDV